MGRVSSKLVLAGLGLTLGCLAAAPGAVDESTSTPTNQFPGRTAPSEKRDQNFDGPGVVNKVFIKEGDTVAAGQLLAQQDISADEARLQSLELLAKSDLEVKAEEAQLAKDKVTLARNTELIKTNSISPSEYEDSKLQVTIDELKIDRAHEDHQKAQYDLAEQKAKIEQKKLRATVDGIVSQISTHEGELANSDTQHPTVTIVKNDPLYVEVDLPAAVVKQLRQKAVLQVQYVDEAGTGPWRAATVRFIKPEADPQSNFEHVQLEMVNPEHRSSGLQVAVKLPENLAAAARVSPDQQ